MNRNANIMVISSLLALLLAACGPKSGNQPPPSGKPGAFQLSGNVECSDGTLSVLLSWTASSGAVSYQLLKNGEVLAESLTERNRTDMGPFTTGSSNTYLVRASNGQGTTDSNSWTADLPECGTEEPPEPDPLEAVSVATGRVHSLAAMADGRVLSWGTNVEGSLGHPDTAEDEVVEPRFIQGLENIQAVAVGDAWSMALDNEGAVWSWGRNDAGQLGNGTTTATYLPQKIGSITETIQAVVAGDSYALALTEDRQVYAWGTNGSGQLGAGGESREPRLLPALIEDLNDVTQLAAGQSHALAVHTDGTVSVWGYNGSGQLGQGNDSRTIHTPMPVPGLSGVQVQMVAAGREHSAALSLDGQLYTWGRNGEGQLGTGDGGLGNEHHSPQPVDLPGVATVVAAADHTFARDDDGNWWAWGDNRHGKLGDGSGHERHMPVALASDLDIQLLATGPFTTVAVDIAGRLYAWGRAVGGRVGIVSSLQEPTPGPVLGLDGVLFVAGGTGHSLAVTEAGHVYAWGDNDRGQLGMGDHLARPVPTRIESLTGALAVAAGFDHSLVLLSDGSVYAFGSNEFGQLGIGVDTTDQLSPVLVGGDLTGASVIVARNWHSLAIGTGGEVWSWGRGLTYQLGVGDTDFRYEPTRVGDLTGVTGLSTGGGHTLAVVPGGASAWGDGINGQLGIGQRGTGVNSKVPVDVGVLTGPSAISAGDASSYAVEDGQLYVWGSNHHGQLGDGSVMAEAASPTELAALSTVKDVKAGNFHVLALLEDGSVYTWGENSSGQLGNGTNTEEHMDTPARILEGHSVTAIFSGPEHSFALLQDGTLLGWGVNNHGQLGNGLASRYRTPQPVPFEP